MTFNIRGLLLAFTPVLFLLFSFNSFSTPFDLKGVALNDAREPIGVGNVLILNPSDSSLLKGGLFMDGSFVIKGISENKFLLKITALGYGDYFQVIENKNNAPVLDIGTIVLKPILLKGVEIVARQKIIEKRDGNIVVNIANTSLSNSGTAMDVLRNSPKVFINSVGQVSIIGKGNALIYVDGQLTASNQILQSLSSVDLKEIEIIENPSAKYDAAGNAVINIITKGSNLEGFKIGLIQELEKRKYFRSHSKINTYFKANKFMFQASYGIRPFTWGGREHYFRAFEENDQLTEVDNKLKYARKILAHDYSFKTTYQINKENKIGFNYTGGYSGAEKDAINKNIFNTNGNNEFNLNTDITGPYDQTNNTFNLFYEKTLDTLGSSLFVTGQYATYDLDRLENIFQQLDRGGNISSLNRRTYNINNIGVSTFQLDYTKNLPSNIQFNSGFKNAHITNKSILDFRSETENGDFILNPALSSDYDYTENILAGYGQLNWQKNNFTISIGLRGEWTQTDGVSGDGPEGKIFSKNYFNLFPSIAISQKINDDYKIALNYNYRIQRPTFQDLNPFSFYVDSLVSLKGNAELVPEYSHSINTAFTIKNFTFDINYTRTNDKINTIIEIPDLEAPSVFAFIRDNIENTSNWAASLTFPINKKWYYSYNVIGGRVEAHNYMDQGEIVANKKTGYYLYTNQSIQLPADIKLEIIYQYTSPRVDGIYTDNPISALSIAASRKFFDNQLNVRILGNDIFDKYKFTGISNFNNIRMDYLSEGDWHFIKLSLGWDFGKMGVNNFGGKKISNEELRRISRQ